MKKHRILPLILAALMLTACSGNPDPAGAPAEPESTVTQSVSLTDAPAEPVDMHTIQPAEDGQAAGNMVFYIDGMPAHAGMVLSDALGENVSCDYDLDQPVEPGHFSLPIPLRFPGDKTEGFLFVSVMNPTDAARPMKDCLIYSLSVSCRDGMEVGYERMKLGSASFDTFVKTYGEPDDRLSWTNYERITYYSPLSCAVFTFKNGKLDQASAYHIAQLYQTEIEAFGSEPTGDMTARDGYILLNSYFDTTPYMNGEEGAPANVDITMTIDAYDVTLGCKGGELPEVWAEKYTSIITPIGSERQMRVGMTGLPEFSFYNNTDSNCQTVRLPVVAGAYLLNPDSDNFGVDHSGHVSYSYMGIANTDDISVIVDKMGKPTRLSFMCDDDHCFAWLFYAAENGDEAQFKVDLFTGEQIELRVLKYYKEARPY